MAIAAATTTGEKKRHEKAGRKERKLGACGKTQA